jgi:hypothetical protein
VRPAFRRPVAGRRPGRATRSEGLFTPARVAGALLMLAASALLNWLTAPDNFRLDPAQIRVEGLRYTPIVDVVSLMEPEIADRPNMFRLPAQALARRIDALPAVASVEVRASLPDTLSVHVREREPVMIWQADGRSWLVDASGALVADASVGTEDLPTVVDRRSQRTPLEVGGQLDSIDLAAALRLAALTPGLLESAASGLSLEVEDEDGWLLIAEPPSWRAAFGHYTTNLRPPTLIDQQAQCLRSLLADREADLLVIFLAPSPDGCGTFRARPTPDARIFQNVRAKTA